MNRDQLRAAMLARKPVMRAVKNPEFGDIYVREMTGAERDRFDAAQQAQRDAGRPSTEGFRARLLQATVCDADGKLLFDISELPQLDALPAGLTEPLCDLALDLNGLSQKAAEDIEGN